MSTSVPVEKWGKDHWSTFAYVETRAVDHNGIINLDHMRVDTSIHPQFANRGSALSDKRYPTILNDGSEIQEHDDWSCIADMESVGLLEWKGTGIRPVMSLTDEGHRVAAALRKHKADGGQFKDFRYPQR